MEIAQQRVLSLDAFRGATIAGMILVNNPGSWSAVYPQLEHAAWNGWTFTDLIFPFFLFIVGVAMVFSFAKRKEAGADTRRLYRQVVTRSAQIFLLGLFLNSFPFGLLFGHHFDLATMRIPGVLQRIAVCYLFVSFIYLNTSLRAQLVWLGSLLAGYWMILMLVPVPGYGAGVLEPMGNICWYVDAHLLAGHTWSGAPAPGFDPEGIVSTLGALATTLSGALAGLWLRSNHSKEERTSWMFVIGNACLLFGTILDLWMPINKNLWTPTYVVFMNGWALVCLATFYWLIDVQQYRSWAHPFVVYGMNAIAVFMLSGIVGRLLVLVKVTSPVGTAIPLKAYLYEEVYRTIASPLNASLLFAITFIIVMYAFVWGMWKKQWFWKV